jgi:hypothetical protein
MHEVKNIKVKLDTTNSVLPNRPPLLVVCSAADKQIRNSAHIVLIMDSLKIMRRFGRLQFNVNISSKKILRSSCVFPMVMQARQQTTQRDTAEIWDWVPPTTQNANMKVDRKDNNYVIPIVNG